MRPTVPAAAENVHSAGATIGPRRSPRPPGLNLFLKRRFQNPVGDEVTRLKSLGNQRLLTSSPTVLKAPLNLNLRRLEINLKTAVEPRMKPGLNPDSLGKPQGWRSSFASLLEGASPTHQKSVFHPCLIRGSSYVPVSTVNRRFPDKPKSGNWIISREGKPQMDTKVHRFFGKNAFTLRVIPGLFVTPSDRCPSVSICGFNCSF